MLVCGGAPKFGTKSYNSEYSPISYLCAIRKLEAEGILYLQKTGSKGKIVCMTEVGKDLASRTVMRLLDAENAVLASWSSQDVKKYMELTERFLNDIRERASDL